MPLTNRRILLGVTGSVAACKAVDLVRRLRERGAEVEVILSRGGAAFIPPLTLQAVSGRAVHADALDPATESAMGHIELARWAERILVAPASANTLARLAAGLADDLLGMVCLASTAPVMVAPAMNRQMWQHPATRANVERLQARGVRFLGPDSGDQACGEIGPGRMREPLELVAALVATFGPRCLAGRRVLITAGPTREAIDPVRYLTNHSSGQMGYALAEAARAHGAAVTLISGPVALAPPGGVEHVPVVTAAEMHAAVLERVARCDIFIGAAAVADYRPAEPAAVKLKKDAAERVLVLRRNPDILAEVAARERPPFTVGFAAETDELEAHALDKLRAKRLDLIAANRVGLPDRGFDAPNNALLVLSPGGLRRELGLDSKPRIADALIRLIAEEHDARNPAQDS